MTRIWGTVALVLVVGMASVLVQADGAEDPTGYDIRVTLDPLLQTLAGVQQVDYLNDGTDAVDEITFWLIGNLGAEPNPYLHPAVLDSEYVDGFDPSWTRIHGVYDASDQPLSYELEAFPPTLQTYSLDNGFLTVKLPAPLGPGERVVVNIEFETRFAHALALDNYVYRDTFVWRFGWHPVAVSPEARDGRFVLPAADYRVELTVPAEYHVFGGADRQTELETAEGYTTYEMSNDRPARSVPLVIGPELRAVASTWNGVDLQAVYLPGGETFARLALSHTAEILASHSERFGPFGYQRLVIVESPVPEFYGMAADGMILVGRSMVQLKDMPVTGFYDRFVEYLLAHEAAHLWWGIGIGTDFDAENWISEGFAEYLSISYFEDKYGAFEPNLLTHLQSGLIEDILRSELGYLNLRQHNSEAPYVDLLRMDFDEAIVKPQTDVEDLNGQTIRTYGKGYLVLRALEEIVGRETLWAALVEANVQWRGRVLDVDGFRRLLEEYAGIDLSGFFEDWLYGDVRFDAAVQGFDVAEFPEGFLTTVHLGHEGAVLPITVRATLADGSVIDRQWTPNPGASDTLVLETSSPVVSVHVDPNEMLPDANRFNNHEPRKILVAHPFRSGDAPKVGMPLDAYVISVSPVSVSGRFRNDHLWSLTLSPHIDEDVAYDDIGEGFGSWDINGLFRAEVNRSVSLSGSAAITELDLAGGSGDLDVLLTLHSRSFTHPEIGSAGTFWYPTDQLDFGVGVRGELAHPIPYVSLSFRRSDLLTLYMENALAWVVGIPGVGTPSFATAEWSGSKRVRLGHLLYVDLTAATGATVLGDTPTEFMFSMDRLRSFALPPYGYHQLFGRVEIRFPPLARNAGYAILGITRLENVVASAFVQGGRTWGGCDRVCEPGIRLEAGALATLRLDGILGSSIEFSVGYAYPLYGPDGKPSLFTELGVVF